MEEANKVLADYLLTFNRDFQVTPLESGLAYRKVGNDFIPDKYFCNKYNRVVGGDNVVKFNGKRIQIMPLNGRASYAHARVEVQERLNGSLVIAYQGQTIATQEAPPRPITLRARKGPRCGHTNLSTRLVAAVNPKPVGVQGSVVARCGRCHEESQSKTLESASLSRKPAPDHPWRKWVLTKSLNN